MTFLLLFEQIQSALITTFTVETMYKVLHKNHLVEQSINEAIRLDFTERTDGAVYLY